MNDGFSALGKRTIDPPISWLMKTALDHPNVISLAAGFTDNASLPVNDTRELLNELLHDTPIGQEALQYGSTAGDATLRELTARRLRQLDGADSSAFVADRLLITHGSQQLLYLATEALCDPGDIIVVENPSYFVFLGIMQSRGLEGCGIQTEQDGIDLADLERKLEQLKQSGRIERVKMVYLVTYHQNPSGITTSLAKKAGALKLLKAYESAAGHPIFLLEDAAYRELRFKGKDIPSALSIPGYENRVIYSGTYSKPFATGVRIGFSIAPQPLFDVLRRIKGNHDFGTANLMQQLMARALSSGVYHRHQVKLIARYAHKAQLMENALRLHFPKQAQWQTPDGGLYFWVRLPKTWKTGAKSKFFKSALARDVLYTPGEYCYAQNLEQRPCNHEMRLSFGSASEKDLQEGIARLGVVLKELF